MCRELFQNKIGRLWWWIEYGIIEEAFEENLSSFWNAQDTFTEMRSTYREPGLKEKFMHLFWTS